MSFCRIVSGERHVWHVTYSSEEQKTVNMVNFVAFQSPNCWEGSYLDSSLWNGVALTDISPKNTFNLFLLKLALDNQLITSIYGATIQNMWDACETHIEQTWGLFQKLSLGGECIFFQTPPPPGHTCRTKRCPPPRIISGTALKCAIKQTVTSGSKASDQSLLLPCAQLCEKKC